MGRDGADNSQRATQDSGEHSGFSFSSIMGKAKEFGGKALDNAQSVGGKALEGAKEVTSKAGTVIKKEVNDPHNRALVKDGADIAVKAGKDTSVGHAIQTRNPEDIGRAARDVLLSGGPQGYIIKEGVKHAAPVVVDRLPPSAKDKVKPAAEYVERHGISSIPTSPTDLLHQAARNPQAASEGFSYVKEKFGNLHIIGSDSDKRPASSDGEERRVKR